MEGVFAPFISSEVYIRQRLPASAPTVIYPTESKFLFTTGQWKTTHTYVCAGYYLIGKYPQRIFINFKDLSAINLKRKIYKVYLRLIGMFDEINLPTQIFAHKIETGWQGITNWNEQPIYSKMPTTSSIVSNAMDNQYFWDVTDSVLEWSSGLSPNNEIALKSNETLLISTGKCFYNLDPVKKPSLLVYYID